MKAVKFLAKSLLVLALAGAAFAATSASAEVVLHRGNGGEPQTLDQAHTSIDVEANILKDLYEGLTVYDAAGNIIPGIAESWTVSDDGLTYTFKLRADAKWSNGDPVTAERLRLFLPARSRTRRRRPATPASSIRSRTPRRSTPARATRRCRPTSSA